MDDADNYSWNSWAWALNRQDEPDESTLDQRQIDAETHNCEMEFIPEQTGFTLIQAVFRISIPLYLQ